MQVVPGKTRGIRSSFDEGQSSMPTNLPPEYFEVEKRYREAESDTEKAACLEELLGTIPKHKGTDHLRANLRRQLAKLKAAAQTRKKLGKHVSAFHIEREGAGQAVVVGATNVGKSALVTALTNAGPEVADYPFTTWTPTPGMMLVDNVPVQLVDTPPLDRDFNEPELFDLIRRADLVLLMVDLQTDPIQQLEDTLSVLHEHRITPCRRDQPPAEEGQPSPRPLMVLVNKCDDEQCDADFQALCELLGDDLPMLPTSVTAGRNLERLKQLVFEQLGIVRVYAKPPGKAPDLSTPFVVRQGTTVAELAGKIHKDFCEHLKTARVWGSTAYGGQLVSRDYVLQDGDVVELRI
jgi:ribosome-interacting GTPase 1